jgi:hypothetical protein
LHSPRRYQIDTPGLEPVEVDLTTWTREVHLTFDIAFALKKVTIRGFRKALKEEDRIAIAKTILEHLKLCRWVEAFRAGAYRIGEPNQ